MLDDFIRHHGKLAVLIPVFNDPVGLRASLDSIIDAKRPEGMLTIVVDDGSSPPVVSTLLNNSEIGLVIVRLANNQGIERALNAGLEEAFRCGVDYVARLDAGDTISPDRLERQLMLLEQNAELGIVGSSTQYVDNAGSLLFVFRAATKDAEIRRRMHINSCLIHPSTMIRMSILKQVGTYSTDYPAAEDYELFFRVLSVSQACCIDAPLVNTVASANGISGLRRRTQLISRLRIQWKYFRASIPEAYVGLFITMILLVTPRGLVTFLKHKRGTTRY
jgi:glycosyltransferase involved in cell wall biosynthesis